jgi:hypothetical protein
MFKALNELTEFGGRADRFCLWSCYVGSTGKQESPSFMAASVNRHNENLVYNVSDTKNIS